MKKEAGQEKSTVRQAHGTLIVIRRTKSYSLLSGFAEPRGNEVVDPAQRVRVVDLVEEFEDSFLIIHAITTFSALDVYNLSGKHCDTGLPIY